MPTEGSGRFTIQLAGGDCQRIALLLRLVRTDGTHFTVI
jgi:hypothetical protein